MHQFNHMIEKRTLKVNVLYVGNKKFLYHENILATENGFDNS